eukprot:8919832-Alexandrium_andersonii.AAC.1
MDWRECRAGSRPEASTAKQRCAHRAWPPGPLRCIARTRPSRKLLAAWADPCGGGQATAREDLA